MHVDRNVKYFLQMNPNTAFCFLEATKQKKHPLQINPVTAYGFLEVIQVPEGKYLLQQAANSVLGKELISMAQKRGTKTINLVRRHEVVDELKQLG